MVVLNCGHIERKAIEAFIFLRSHCVEFDAEMLENCLKAKKL